MQFSYVHMRSIFLNSKDYKILFKKILVSCLEDRSEASLTYKKDRNVKMSTIYGLLTRMH